MQDISVLLQRLSGIMKSETKLLLVLLASCMITVACGQKGPLFLPGRSSTFESMTPPQQPVSEEESDEDDEERTENIN